jgi:hypothetical protein
MIGEMASPELHNTSRPWGCIYVRGNGVGKALRVGDHATMETINPLDDSSSRFFEYRVSAMINHSGLEFRYKYERAGRKL